MPKIGQELELAEAQVLGGNVALGREGLADQAGIKGTLFIACLPKGFGLAPPTEPS